MDALKASWPAITAFILLGTLIVGLNNSTNARIDALDRNLSARIDTNTNLLRDLTTEVRANRKEATDQIMFLSAQVGGTSCTNSEE